MPKVTFNNKQSAFYDAIRESVDRYFAENKIRPTGNFKLVLKALTLVPAAAIIYAILVFTETHPAVKIFLSGFLGFILASIGFNIMHDACHGSYSTKKWVNYMMGLSLNCLGGNSFIWKQKHNIIHHTYPNVDGVDDDIAKLPLIRHCAFQKRYAFHRYQHIYGVLLYGLSSFLWIFLTDFIKYFQKKIYTTPIHKMTMQEHIIFWVSKIFYGVVYVAVPVYFLGWMPWFIGFTAMHLVKGFTLAMVFQLAHVVEDTHFADAKESDLKIDYEWAVYQVQTTANFATQNRIISWFVGGLNFQIEHHLFPRVSHVHYPAISRLVRETCEKFGIRYINFPTMSEAVVSHFRFIKQLGIK